MAKPDRDSVVTLIKQANDLGKYVAADRALRELEGTADYLELLQTLNVKSASEMFLFKAEADKMGLTPTFARQAATLRAAGYPSGSAGFVAWRNRILIENKSAEILAAEVLEDATLSEEEQNKALRLIDAKAFAVTPYFEAGFEANWTDVAMAPAARRVIQEIIQRRESVRSYQGSDLYQELASAVRGARNADVLGIIAEEAPGVLKDPKEIALLKTLISFRTIELLGETFAGLVEDSGWEVVQALYRGRDITGRIADGRTVAEFRRMMTQMRSAYDRIREVDAPLAKTMVEQAWTRASQRPAERERVEAATDRLRTRITEADIR